MTKIKDQKIEEFLNELASKNPTPGGGAVAALAGAMAAGLVEMVANLTIGKKGYESVWKRAEDYALSAKEDRETLLKLADEDSAAFEEVMKAYKAGDKKLISKALKLAMHVPEMIASTCMMVDDMAIELEKIGNKNAVSDAKTAQALANAAVNSAMAVVRLNGESLAKLG